MVEALLNFSSREDLIAYLREERKKKERFATRFILVTSWQQWRELIKALEFEVDVVVSLSHFCRGDDVFPYLQGVLDTLEDAGEGKTVLLFPLAEWLRLDWEDGSKLLTKIVEWPEGKIKRLYVPLLAAREMLEQGLRAFNRYREGLLPPVWHLKGGEEEKCELIVAPFARKGMEKEFVSRNGVKDYFSFWEKDGWEKGGVPSLWLVTSWASHLPPPSQAINFKVKVYTDAFSFISDRFNEGLKVEWGAEKQWKWLVEQVEEETDFDSLCGKILNVKNYDGKTLLIRWHSYGADEQWLIWLWGKLREEKGSYLNAVLQRTQKVADLEKEAALTIFSLSPTVELCQQRRELLELLQVHSMPAEFWDCFAQLRDPLKKLQVLTDLSEREKEQVIMVVGSLLEEDANGSWREYLRVAYPDLWCYLQNVPVRDEFAADYFRAYCVSRVKNRVDEELRRAQEEWTEEKYWSYKPRREIVEAEREKGAKVIWVDAMGVEWANLLVSELQKGEEEVEAEIEIVRAVVPSITEVNKEWKEMDERVEYELDKIAHDSTYSFPASFIKSMEFIKSVARKVKEELNLCPRVVITSDHGLSRFALSGEEKKELPPGYAVERGGRYASPGGEGSTGYEIKDEERKKMIVKDGNLIWLTYDRFEGGGFSGGEVHGGATPEECLVPVIIVYRGRKAVRINVLNEGERVKLDHRGEGWLEIEVDKPLASLELRIGGKVFSGEEVSPQRWKFSLQKLGEKEYTAELWELARKIGEVSFTVERRKGIKEDDLGL